MGYVVDAHHSAQQQRREKSSPCMSQRGCSRAQYKYENKYKPQKVVHMQVFNEDV